MENDLKLIFQQEFAKMVAVISNLFGLQYIELAEDIVSETFLTASETWGINGIPENPRAWLYTVAKHKTLHHLRRQKIFQSKVLPALKTDQHDIQMPEPDFSPEHIRDSQLRMLFALCNPLIASEAQIGLALRILCGFGIDEIAEAFLSNKDAINKRLFRAKEKIRSEKIDLEFPSEAQLPKRLENVLHIIYLLFNEGYYSKTQDRILQKDLCLEAMRLGTMLTEYPPTNLPPTNALMALMCFHASRFEARQAGDDLILYEQQDESLWDPGLIHTGIHYLELATTGQQVTTFHQEARIASLHCIKTNTPEKWDQILQLYDALLDIRFSPAAALNRVYALYKVKGPLEALEAVQSLQLQLPKNHFYHLLLGELYSTIEPSTALVHYQEALVLAKTQPEKKGIWEKIHKL